MIDIGIVCVSNFGWPNSDSNTNLPGAGQPRRHEVAACRNGADERVVVQRRTHHLDRGTGDAEHRGDDEAGRVAARHEESRQQADDEPDDDRPDQ